MSFTSFKTESRIFLFSKTSALGVNHIPILDATYLEPSITFSDYDYIIATSKEVFVALESLGDWRELPVLAISEATAAYARELGARVLDVGEGYGRSIVNLVHKKYGHLKALHPHAKVIAFDLNSALSELKIAVDSYVVYQTKCADIGKVTLPDDAICLFSSPSAVECFAKNQEFLESYTVVCIGTTTQSALPSGVVSTLAKETTIPSCIAQAKSLL